MTIEEFRAKKQNILNSRPVKNSNNEMSIDEFRKKKQQILTGVTEQSKTQETVDEQVSSPQTIQQKMDSLWEEEKETVRTHGGSGRSFNANTNLVENETPKSINIAGKEYKVADSALPNQIMLTDEQRKEIEKNAPLSVDKVKSGLGKIKNTAEHILGSGITGAMKGAEGIAQGIIGTGGNFLEKINRDYIPDIDVKNMTKENQQEMINQLVYGKPTETSEKIKETTQELAGLNLVDEAKEKLDKKTNSLYGKYNPKVLNVPVSDIVSEGARMFALSPAGLPGFMTSAAGGNMSEAINEGEELENAVRYGAISGAIEGGTEKMFDTFNILGGGVIDKFLPKSAIGKFITGSLGEGVEEVISESVNPFVKMSTYEGEVTNPLSSKEEFSNYINGIKDAGWQGFVMGMFMQGIHDVSDADVRAQYKAEVSNAVEKIKGLTEDQKKQMVDELINVSETSPIQLSEMENYMNQYKNTSEYSKYISKVENLSNDVTIKDTKLSQLEKLVPMQKNDVLQSSQNTLNNASNQIIPTETKTAQNDNMGQIQPSLENDVKFEETKRFASDYEQKIGRKVNVFTSNDPDIHGYTENGEIYLNSNSNRAKTVTYIHELTHNLEREKAYSKFANEVIESNMFKEFLNNKNTTLQEYQEQIKTAYKEKLNKDLDETGVMHEVIANFAGESKLFDSQESINRLAIENNNIFTKIKDFIDNLVVKFTGTAEEKELRRIQNMYRKALEQARNNTTKTATTNNISMSIETIPNTNKKYVKADRQVIVGNNPLEWEQQVENYINEKIRNNEDVNVLTDDGMVLTITKNTAGKAKFRNEIIDKNGNKRRLNNKEFLSKLRAETHIDELAEVSQFKSGPVEDTKNHDFAKDGFIYRTAYFEDINGEYYKITMSIGQNGDINTIYNIGKMNKTQKNRSNPNSELKGSSGKTTSNRIASNNSINQNDSSVNTQYSLEKQNDTAGKEPVFSMPKIDNSDIRYTVTPTSKSQQYQRRKENAFIKDVSNALGISEFANKQALRKTVSEAAEEIKNGNSQGRDELFEKIFNEGIAVNDEFYNQYKELKNTIKNTKLNINDEIKKGIVDYEQFRKNNFGKLTITGDNSGINIDTYYQELNEQYPELFPTTINTPSDQLVRISEVSKSIEKVKTEISKYAGNDKEYKNWAKNEFDKNFNKLIEEMKIVSRVENDKRIAKEDTKINMSMADNAKIDDLKELYSVIKTLKKDYEKISNKQLLTKKDKTTLDRLLKGEITLKELPKDSNVEGIKKLYAAKKPIMDMENVIKQYNAARKEKLRNEAKNVLENSNNWKEKLTGIQYAREIMERNFVDVAGKKDGEKLNKIYAEPVHIHEADATRLKNKYREQVKALNLSDKELYDISYIGEFQQGRNPNIEEKPVFKKVSERGLVQLYGEGKINDNTLKELGVEVEKIKNAVSTFREIYNDLLEMSNDALVANGYAPVDYRKDYFPHFIDNKSDSLLSKLGSVIGIETNTKELPTDIAGLTHTFRPGKKWVGNFLQRTSEVTDFDAVKGFDRYIEGVADVIFHTEDIQRLRALEDEIRYKYSDKGVQEQIDQIKEDDDIAPEDKRNRIEEIYKTNKHEFPHLVSWLRSYTDSLAGKKSIEDRIAEQQLGRIVYDISKSVENRVAANMIGLNINSWLTNFIPLAQASGTTKGKYLLNAMKDTIRGYAKTDGLRDRSTFLTNREGSDPLVKTFNQKLSSALDGMRIIDNFTSETLVRARYYQNMANGMTQEEALQEADRNTAKIMGDRSKGAMPTLFNVKNPVSKLMTMFQLEQNNQFSYYFKDVPDELKEKGAKAIALALAKIFIASWLYNEAKEELTGSRSAFDPIDILVNLGKNVKNKGIKGTGDTVLELIEATPFIGGLLGGGRIPISSALPDITGLLKGETTVKKELVKPLAYLVAPMGGGQIKKTIEGIDTFAKGGNYGTDSQGRKTLKYPVKQDVGNAVKSALFGKYSTEYAQDYIDNDFKSLSAKQTEGYEKASKQGVSYDVFLKAYNAQKNVEGNKDSNGKTISLSASKNKKKAIDELLPGYTQKQKQTLYEAFGISEKVW